MIESAPLLQRDVATGAAMNGFNYGTSAILAGRVVCLDLAQTATSLRLQGQKRSVGVVLPSAANALRVIGISERDIAAGEAGEIVTDGIVRASVYVPASSVVASFPAGSLLHLATTWDGASNNVFAFGTSAAGANNGVLTALTHKETAGTVVIPCENPIAELLEPLTAAVAAGVQQAWVRVLGLHRPRRFERDYVFSGTVAAKADALVLAARAPLLLTDVAVQLMVAGSAGATGVDLEISPIQGTADQVSIFTASNTPLIDNAQPDTAITGLGCLGTGTTTGYVEDGSNRAGTLKAVASRIMGMGSILAATLTAPTGGAMCIIVGGMYL